MDLIKTKDCDLVVFSLVNLIKPRKTEAYMYVFAEAYSGDEPIPNAQGKLGCPTPPGWSGDIPLQL
ncbi:hypothetical protein [Paraflavitalea speifideaquila]|uniref:hypothetical protein n=1 Tax=Paraflavitalea speifideaquila TaxID=3076558 RepID=UPI0028EB0D33|nr:hypothetical protein [Paraflavitalea speifideiaquila]